MFSVLCPVAVGGIGVGALDSAGNTAMAVAHHMKQQKVAVNISDEMEMFPADDRVVQFVVRAFFPCLGSVCLFVCLSYLQFLTAS